MRQFAFRNLQLAATGLILLAASSASLACRAATRLLPTAVPPTASATPTRAPTRTPQPTLTPTPLPDISGIMLLQSDLPKGFKARQLRGLDEAELKRLEMVPEDFFLFISEQSAQAISGYRILLKDELDRRLSDEDIADQQQITDYLASWAGADDVLDSKLLNGFDQVGDSRMAISIGYKVQERHYRVDGVVFRRGSIYVLMTIDYPDGYKPLIKLKDLAAIFDARIREYPEVAH